nr:MAG TPA: hypothetical protein [Caudoviricetes sp.]
MAIQERLLKVSSIVRVFYPRVLCSEEPKARAYRYESRIWSSIAN